MSEKRKLNLTSGEIAFLLGMLDTRLKRQPTSTQAKRIWNKILRAFPELKREFGLEEK